MFGIFIFFRPIITSSIQYSQAGTGDTILNNFFLEHSLQMISNDSYSGTWWSPLFFYPQKSTLAYSDNLWGTAPIYWLLRSAFVPLTAFQLWMIALATLNYLSFFILARSFRINTWLAAFGAFLFAFSLPRQMQLGHQQLLPQFYSILAILFLYKFFKSKKIAHFILFELFIYLQLLAGIYLGWFLLFILPILIIVHLLLFFDKIIIRSLFSFKIFISFVIFCALTLTTLSPYISAQNDLGRRAYSEVLTMLPGVASYANFASGSIFSEIYPAFVLRKTASLPMRQEHYLFPGIFIFILLSVALAGFIVLRRTLKIGLPYIFIVGSTLFVILTAISLRLPFTDFSLWNLIYYAVPGAGAIRAVTRIWTISYLFLYLAIIGLATSTYSHTTSKIFKTTLLLLAFLACIEQTNLTPYYFDKHEQEKIQKQINNTIQGGQRGLKLDAFYIHWPKEQSYIPFQTKAMWASLELNLPTINGYSGNVPRGYKTIEQAMTKGEVEEWLVKTNVKPLTVLFIEGAIVGGNFFANTSSIITTVPLTPTTTIQ